MGDLEDLLGERSFMSDSQDAIPFYDLASRNSNLNLTGESMLRICNWWAPIFRANFKINAILCMEVRGNIIKQLIIMVFLSHFKQLSQQYSISKMSLIMSFSPSTPRKKKSNIHMSTDWISKVGLHSRMLRQKQSDVG